MVMGIDYGMGRTNRDPGNGIRYGVISQHSIMQAWCESSEADYGPATCPKCGNPALDYDGDKEGEDWESSDGCSDYMCESCEYVFDSSEAFGEEPIGFTYSDEGYELVNCLDSDVMVLKSPYFTYAPFCSPCVPGAGNLDDATERAPFEDGVQTYCLGHDWFEDGKAPYPVYSVETGKEVQS